MEKETIKRFLKYVLKTNNCWLWTGSKNMGGYGTFRIKTNYWTHITAHRMSYEIFISKIPKGLFVLHKCDNPSCVNPKHLFVGTQKDNCIDRKNKGRGANLKGENNGRSIITLKQAKKIRKMYSTGEYTLIKLGKIFGIKKSMVSYIINNKNWNY